VILRGKRVVLRPGMPEDVPRLASILSEPDVILRWGLFTEQEVAKQFVDDKAFVVEQSGEVIGAIQFDEEEDPKYRHASIDIFLTTPRQHQGFGSEAIRTLARYLIQERGHHRLTIDPSIDNETAIRAYRRVGFREVGVMRQYERGSDGTWHAGLLMELLAGELTGDEEEPDRNQT
jgi:aminoglycoside 6'-N-acetyltransferase